jgi:DNA-binding NarL/FixJ family response regulator
MKRVYFTAAYPDKRSANRLLLTHFNLMAVGEAGDWPSTLETAAAAYQEIVLVDYALIRIESHESFHELRQACNTALIIILTSHLEAREQAAISAGADAFISRGETPERTIEQQKAVVWSQPA